MTDKTKKISDFPSLNNPNGNTRILVSHTSNTGVTNTFNLTIQKLTDTVVDIYVPTANSTASGIVKVGNNLFINASGHLMANLSSVSINTSSLTANSTNFVGSVSAANVVSNAQLQSNLSNYVTTTGLSDNLSNYVTISGLSSNVIKLTSNTTNFVGSVSAANVVSNAQLQANLANITTGILQHTPVSIAKVLSAISAANNQQFGSAVAINSDATVLAVGSSEFNGYRGTVYVYDWNGYSWIQRGDKITANDAAFGARFGYSVSLNHDGTLLMVGSPQHGAVLDRELMSGTSAGCVYPFTWNGSTWVQGTLLGAADTHDYDMFGRSVCLSCNGTVLAVGADGWNDSDQFNPVGAVYIYDYVSGNTTWVQRGSVIRQVANTTYDNFGWSVALNSKDATVLAVGAYSYSNSYDQQGAVYIYDYVSGNTTWVQRGSTLTASDANNYNNFGYSVSLNDTGNVLTVGSDWYSANTDTKPGAVYVYDWKNSNWQQRGSPLLQPECKIDDDDHFASSVSLSPDASILVVGAKQWEANVGTNRGAVYTFSLTGKNPSSSLDVSTGSGLIESNSTIIARTSGSNRLVIDTSGNILIGTINATSVGISANNSSIKIGNSSVNSIINSTVFSATANNTNYVGSVSAANVVSNAQLVANLANYATTSSLSSYQTTAGLASNVAILTANNATYLNGTAASGYQTTAGLSANVATLTSNNTTYVGSVSAANVVSNAQLVANLTNYATTSSLSSYQTTAGLSANVATLTANNTSYVGSVSAANVVSNAQLVANLANYATTSSLTTYVQNTDSRTLSGNLTFSAYLTTGIGATSVLKIGKAEEGFTTYNNVNGSFTFDCSNSNIFYATSACSTFTPVLSNFICENNYAVGISVILNQGASAQVPTSNVTISGSNVSVNWQGGSTPSGTANKKDIVTYSILNISGSYTVLGQLTSFG